jgi:hypothetical protein
MKNTIYSICTFSLSIFGANQKNLKDFRTDLLTIEEKH